MKPSSFLIVLDQGSSGSRAEAFGADGKIAVRAHRKLEPFYPAAGRAEYDAARLYAGQAAALEEVLDALPAGAEIRGLAVACQRSTFVMWDSSTGEPLCPAPSWQDGRAADLLGRVRLLTPAVHSVTGLYKTPYYSASKMAWCLQHLPAVSRAASAGRLMTGPVASYILWRLSGGKIFACDYSLAQRTLLFNISKLRWEPRLLSAFKVPPRSLPAALPSGAAYGEVELRGRRVPVAAVIGDQQAALTGLGACGEGVAGLNYGTGAFLMAATGPRPLRVKGMLNSIGWDDRSAGTVYFLEATMNSCGTALEWLKQRFGLLGGIEEAAAACASAGRPAMVLPAIGGIGAPYWDYSTYTTVSGLTPQTGKAELVKGFVEGIAFMLADSFHHMRAGGVRMNSLRASGGLSNLDALLAAQADLCGVEVMRLPDSEASARGAALTAASALGLRWFGAPPAPSAVFRPRMDEKRRKELLSAWRAFVRDAARMSKSLRKFRALER
ncbi:MAG TPA: FGGY family carbohydrate kinase [Elusimicrobiales bacterium]|nr:FGGY family carbohydrate kinase [Elusimicrobiales bacterium]